MKYAVIKLQGKQYKVEEGQVLDVDRLPEGEKTLEVKDVLLVADGSAVKIGDPLVKGASVKLTIEAEKKGEKIRVATYKAKSRYRKVKGHRQSETTVKVASISA